ncbi:hypothetical protein GCM10020220_085680 [Nonomuraea rubra]|uniref:glycosyltransferase family 2 protein n=1 Tax=Nonomuraea rubra TaxID=46180 RepID=UPI0031E70D8D
MWSSNPDALPLLLRHFTTRAWPWSPRVCCVLRLPGRDRWVGRYETPAPHSTRRGMRHRPPSRARLLGAQRLPAAKVDALGSGFSAGMRVGEDVDLACRLAAKATGVRYEPAATVYHEHRTAIPDWLRRKAFYGTGADLLAQRHGRDVAPAIVTPWSAAFATALLLQRRWSLPAAALIFAAATLRLSRKVRNTEHPVRLGAVLTFDRALAATWQLKALLLRHWWPLAAIGCLFSRRMRRAVAAAALFDTIVDFRRTKAHLDPFRFAVARRLDDLAYGSGVWYGAFKGRSLRALLPDIRWTGTRGHDTRTEADG